jgi:Flp pilus assembly protein TadD
MARVVRFPAEEVEGLDEEFLYHLKRGADHLARGEADAARVALAQAAKMRPRDPKVLGLLGQACYRLERFPDAAEAYGLLVQETPLEPNAQVNLGLALLKAGRAAEAITHLERALDLNPEHRRAMGYLGLAWMKQGNVARAREWFERAGRDQMVAKCDALLRGNRDRAEPKRTPPDAEVHGSADAPAAPPPPAAPAPGADGWKVVAPSGEAAPVPQAELDREVSDAMRILEPGGKELADELEEVPVPVAAEPEAPAPAAPPVEPPPREAKRAAPAAKADPPAAGEPPPAEPAAKKPARAAKAPPAPPVAEAAAPPVAPATFTTSPTLRVAVDGEVLVRLPGLVVVEGAVELSPETRRVRGRSVQESFGTGRDAVHRARGSGALRFRAGERRFTTVDVRGAGHFREEAVFGFEALLGFENGRLAAPGAAEIELVKLVGDGAALVASRGELVAIEVTPDRPVRVAATALLGWSGALTPRLVPLARAEADAVELSGEGRVLVDPGAPAGAA